MTFDPERWLTDELPLDPWTVGFGYGRRICPGTPLSQAELWIVFATIVWSLEISQKVDKKTGKRVEFEPTWSGEMIS